MTLLLIYLFLALGVSFVCSVLEAVLLSVNPSYIAVLREQNHPTADLLYELKDDVDRPLSSILSMNTIAHTIGAAGVGAQAQVVFGSAYVTTTSIILTLLILVLSEIIPKTIGATYWRALAPFSARLLKWMIVILYPLVALSKGITKWLSRGPKDPSFSREEFSAMAEQGVREGVIEDKESRIFRNLMRFETVRVRDIMTPRTVVISYPESFTIQDLKGDLEELRFTRIPVYGESEDDISGYVLKQDLLIQLARGHLDTPLKELKREMLIVPDIMHLRDLFERLLERQEHIAIAVDEYGGFSGVVTMEDLVETLLGMEIVDEVDAIDDMQQWARSNWRKRAKRLGILPEEQADSPTTT
ncbi:MAG: hemolysin family protein [Bacteroidota bacterium]